MQVILNFFKYVLYLTTGTLICLIHHLFLTIPLENSLRFYHNHCNSRLNKAHIVKSFEYKLVFIVAIALRKKDIHAYSLFSIRFIFIYNYGYFCMIFCGPP